MRREKRHAEKKSGTVRIPSVAKQAGKKTSDQASETSAIDAIVSSLPKIVESPSASAFYEEELSKIEHGVEATVQVTEPNMGQDYAVLSIEPDKRTISYRTESGAISYKTLTHVMSGRTLSFGLACSQKGEIELFLFGSKDSDTDCKLLARMRPSRHVIDPMFALHDRHNLYLICNRPSKRALATSVSNRVPFLENGVASADGSPMVIRFDLLEETQEDVLGEIDSLGRYACGTYLEPETGHPYLLVGNFYEPPSEKEASRASLKELLSSLLEDEPIKTSIKLPIGLLTLGFIGETEIIQLDPDGDLGYGVESLILSDSNEDGQHAFYLTGVGTSLQLESEKEGKSDTEEDREV